MGTVYLSIDMSSRNRGDSMVSVSRERSTSVVVLDYDENDDDDNGGGGGGGGADAAEEKRANEEAGNEVDKEACQGGQIGGGCGSQVGAGEQGRIGAGGSQCELIGAAKINQNEPAADETMLATTPDSSLPAQNCVSESDNDTGGKALMKDEHLDIARGDRSLVVRSSNSSDSSSASSSFTTSACPLHSSSVFSSCTCSVISSSSCQSTSNCRQQQQQQGTQNTASSTSTAAASGGTADPSEPRQLSFGSAAGRGAARTRGLAPGSYPLVSANRSSQDLKTVRCFDGPQPPLPGLRLQGRDYQHGDAHQARTRSATATDGNSYELGASARAARESIDTPTRAAARANHVLGVNTNCSTTAASSCSILDTKATTTSASRSSLASCGGLGNDDDDDCNEHEHNRANEQTIIG